MPDRGRRVYGIDLGTTYSAVGFVDETGRASIARNGEGEETTPSVVYLESPTNVVVGTQAKAIAKIEPDHVVSLVKRQMGTSALYSFHGQEHTPESLSALILKHLAAGAEVDDEVRRRRHHRARLLRDAGAGRDAQGRRDRGPRGPRDRARAGRGGRALRDQPGRGRAHRAGLRPRRRHLRHLGDPHRRQRRRRGVHRRRQGPRRRGLGRPARRAPHDPLRRGGRARRGPARERGPRAGGGAARRVGEEAALEARVAAGQPQARGRGRPLRREPRRVRGDDRGPARHHRRHPAPHPRHPRGQEPGHDDRRSAARRRLHPHARRGGAAGRGVRLDAPAASSPTSPWPRGRRSGRCPGGWCRRPRGPATPRPPRRPATHGPRRRCRPSPPRRA